uniref:Cathepsin 13 n=1 Tax=Philasterides dicentrarchi TaxID=282688 RepID=A0A481SC88_9CILI|nr:cathepsin 13 [Philasterides dicentrarchi]
MRRIMQEKQDNTQETVKENDDQLPQDAETQLQPFHVQESQSLQLKNILNRHYDAIVYIGDSKKEFNLIVDTGSTMLWIADQQCSNCGDMGITNKYNCQKSNSCKLQEGEEYKEGLMIEYGHGQVAGKLANELVFLENSKESKGVNIPILLVQQIQDLQQLSSDGILGLGREKNAEIDNSFLKVLKDQQLIDKKVFSLYLSGQQCSKNSILAFGGYDPSNVNGQMDYLDIASEDFWGIKIDQIQFKQNNKSKEINLQSKLGIIDSGTTKITFPTIDINQIIRYLKSQNIECVVEETNGIQDLICSSSIKKSGMILVIKSGNVNFKLEFENLINQCYLGIKQLKGSVCRMDIQVVDLDQENFIILGEVFMQKYVIVFDEENKKIGFGIANHNSDDQRIDPFKSLYVVFFQTGLICIIMVLIVILSNLYHRHINKVDNKISNINNESQASSATNQTGPQGVTIDISNNGIESFDEGDASHASHHHEEVAQDGVEQVGGRLKQTERESTREQ